MKFNEVYILLLWFFSLAVNAQTEENGPGFYLATESPSISGNSSFAIIVDSTTFVNVGTPILEFRQTIENDGLPTWLIIANWPGPEPIKEKLIELYNNDELPLEGAVFIGDIPIVAVQDAQHLTSAFRMDQTGRTLAESSVPSDRFYDDFDLKFEFIEHDNANPLIHYYRLLPESPVKLNRDIYSARIPVLHISRNKYKILKQYFKKVVKIKSAPLEQLDQLVCATGFNYLSDSYTAVTDEIITLREIFGMDKSVKNRIYPAFHRCSDNPKQQLLHYLELSKGDLFLIHSHGNELAQFIQENEQNKLIADENISSAADQEASTEDATTISLDEINRQKIDTEFVILDVCYNGAFQKDRYMAAAYLYSQGEVVTVMANSVNVRQDIAILENLGALAYGARIGQWHQMENYLESHLFGDPTFRYASRLTKNLKNPPPFERYREEPSKLEDFWEQEKVPYLRASALSALYKFKPKNIHKYLKEALRDPHYIVRLKAWIILASMRNAEFTDLLPEGLQDSYELIRRYCAIWMGEIGNNTFVQHLAKAAISDPSERVVFNALISLKLIGTKEARTALKWVLSEINNYDDGKFIQQVRANLFTMSQWLPNEVIPPLTNGTPEEKIKHIRLFRANRHLVALPTLIFLYENDPSPEVRVAAAETLGWYAFYEKRNLIEDTFKKTLLDINLDEDIKKATILAHRRLMEGCNQANTP